MPSVILEGENLRKRHDECVLTIRRAMIAFLSASLVCLIAIAKDNGDIIRDRVTVKVPFTGTDVGYEAFLAGAPLLLMLLWIYLRVYLNELEHPRFADLEPRIGTLLNLPGWLPQAGAVLVRSVILPLMLVLIALKASVFSSHPYWVVVTVLGTIVVLNSESLLGWGGSYPVTLAVLAVAGAAIITNPGWNIVVLVNADLAGRDLRGVRLVKADMANATLVGARLDLADLRQASLPRANLSRANLWRANLSEAFLFRADLSKAQLVRADLSQAVLDLADLSEAILRNANLSRAYLGGANLNGADLTLANLEGAKLSAARLNNAILERADLRDAKFSGAHLARANLTGAKLERARFVRADLESAIRPEDDIPGWKADADGRLHKVE